MKRKKGLIFGFNILTAGLIIVCVIAIIFFIMYFDRFIDAIKGFVENLVG